MSRKFSSLHKLLTLKTIESLVIPVVIPLFKKGIKLGDSKKMQPLSSYLTRAVDRFLLWWVLSWPCQGTLSLCPWGARGIGKGSAVRSQAVRIWSWPLAKEKQARILNGV